MPYSTASQGPLAPVARALGYVDFNQLPEGVSFAGDLHTTGDVRLLADSTWLDEQGERHLDHCIFDEILAMIDGAHRLILLDLFLFNDLLLREKAVVRPRTQELTEALLAKRREEPAMPIIFITDPCNTAWGGMRSPYLEELAAADITVVTTDLDVLRDSSPVYSLFWRAFLRPFGNRVGGIIPNPFGEGTITLRSLLNIPNMKANHRKTVLTDAGDTWAGMVTSMNPHDASFAHRNVALRFEGPAVADLYLTERAVMEFSNAALPTVTVDPPPSPTSDVTLQILTEGRIKDCVMDSIERAGAGDELVMVLFYLAERSVIRALEAAAERGADIRIILDRSKDAFGWRKYGVPNRPVAHFLTRRGIKVRWADTRGEQCHTKMLVANYAQGDSLLLVGSANFTRRNLNNFNLETDVCIRGPASAAPIRDAGDVFELLWHNRDGRRFTTEYERYEERAALQHWIYWLMENTGISTF